MSDLSRLNKLDEAIQEMAKREGLDFFPQKFDLIPADKMLEFMAYGFPNNFAWWGYGRDYEILRKKYENTTASIPFEVVYNLNPSRAYVIKDMPLALQVLTMCHVYGHNHFMKNNSFFRRTNRGILSSASFARERFQEYEHQHGLEAVEKVIDAGKAIEMNINFDLEQDPECESDKRKRLLAELSEDVASLGRRPALRNSEQRREELEKIRAGIIKRTPLEPEQDLLFYLIDKASLEEWEKDVLSVIWEQSRYHVPQRRTKIMNEGRASDCHVRFMEQLHDEKLITNEEFDTFNVWSSRVLTDFYLPYSFNPYTLGLAIWRDIRERWDKGRFGKEYEECEDAHTRANWDRKAGLGNQKVLGVVAQYSDMNFIDEFLTKDLIDKMEMWLYEPAVDEFGKIIRDSSGRIRLEVAGRDWQMVKKFLKTMLVNFGMPYLTVENGCHDGSGLYLKHHWEGVALDKEYREGTVAHIRYLWKKPIYLETVEIVITGEGEKARLKAEIVLYSYNGKSHDRKVIGSLDSATVSKIFERSPFLFMRLPEEDFGTKFVAIK